MVPVGGLMHFILWLIMRYSTYIFLIELVFPNTKGLDNNTLSVYISTLYFCIQTT